MSGGRCCRHEGQNQARPCPHSGAWAGWSLTRKQAGRRPAIVLSHTRYNDKTGLAIFCPITSRVKGYPFELAMPAGLPVSGVVLCDHVRSQDWKERQWQPICQVPAAFVQEVLARTLTLFDLPAGG